MVEQLTQEQIDSFPRFRDKWTNIGRSTGRADLSVVKPIINKIYEQKDLEAPKYFFHFGNPMDMLNGRVICRMLNSFDPKNYQKDTINLDNDFMRIFDMTYQMYSEQFDLKTCLHTEKNWKLMFFMATMKHTIWLTTNSGTNGSNLTS